MSATFSHTVTSSTTYHYRVVADNQIGGSSGFSNIQSVQVILPTPGAPTVLSASDGAYAGVMLTWTAPSTGGAVTGYYIYRYTSNNSSAASQIGTSSTTSYYDVPPAADTYWYWVRAYNSYGPGPTSNGDSGHPF